jgi:sulfatase maturation enzyme AslB (radical SAM superfamily)
MPKRLQKVYIEISNVCNLQCSFCPEVERGKGFMEPDLFRKVTAAVVPLTDEVCFHLMGEPLLHPEFDDYLRFCGTLGLRVNLTTNGMLLNPELVQALMDPALKQINFSLQSFEANFPGKDNSEYLQKIFDFTQRALVERPDLYINYRLWNQGAEGAPASNARLIEKIKDALQVDFDPFADVRWKKSVKIKGRLYLHFDSRFIWPHPAQPLRSTKGFCHGLSSHIGILADGTVVPCCLDKEGVISLGNCGRRSIDEIIDGSRATSIREGFRKGVLVEDLCQKCTFIARFDRKAKGRQSGPAAHGSGNRPLEIR